MFIAKGIITAEWINKKQFYKIVGMEGEKDGDMVNVRIWSWEYEKKDIEQQIEQVRLTLKELEEKLALFID